MMMPQLAADHQRQSYHYDLPEQLIAQRPCSPRDHSRLLVYHCPSGEVQHARFYELAKFLPAGATLVLNESKVFACRLPAQKSSGGAAEVFFLHPLSAGENEVLIRCSGKKRVGQEFLAGESKLRITQVLDNGHFKIELVDSVAEKLRVPIPPYIRKGESDEQDFKDYQTTFAKQEGSVAAPTAGLHFTEKTFADLDAKGIETAKVSLHVGAGTFAPVKSDDIREHQMHTENYLVEPSELAKIERAKRVVAVGSTSLRTVESLYRDQLSAGEWHSTQAFLYPGHGPKKVTDLLTNFHLPESTLIMLVASMLGREKTLELYELAVAEKYRFFSYGDAMLILGGES